LWPWIAASLLLVGCAAIQPQVDPPRVALADLRILDITLFEQRYLLRLRIQNPNPFDLPITGMDFTLHINEREFGSGVSRQAVTVPAYGEEVVDVKVISNLARVFQQLHDWDEGRGGRLSYRLSGGLSLANRIGKIPFEYRGELGAGRERSTRLHPQTTIAKEVQS